VLERLGADQVVIPEQENANRLAHRLSSPNVLDYIELSNDYGIIEVPVPKPWQNKTLKELDVRARLGINIIAVKRGGRISAFPAGDHTFAPDDVMVVLGDMDIMEKVQKL
jgi:trk system potassium uptake protein TrkA